MKNILYTGLLLLLVVLAGMFIKINLDFDEYQRQTKISKYEYDKRLEELEKDIRILKMDSYINTNGFEGVE